jgi:hypothetical protein
MGAFLTTWEIEIAAFLVSPLRANKGGSSRVQQRQEETHESQAAEAKLFVHCNY